MEERVELILQYVGDLDSVQEQLGFSAVTLLGGYAVIQIEPEKIGELEQYPEIVYIETPKRLFFEVNEGRAEACIREVQAPSFSSPGLDGAGVLLAVIDSGIDYFHPDFRKEDGQTRIGLLWDQSIQEGREGIGSAYLGDPALGYVYTAEQINQALSAGSRQEGLRLVPSQDISGHGTHVAGIAAGNGRASGGRYRGVAYESELIVVKLGKSVGNSYPQTAGLMEAVDFAVRTAIQRSLPLAVNISFGNNEGSHNGRSILESYLSSVAEVWKTSIVIGTGNEGTLGRHQGGFLEKETYLELSVAEVESQIEFWLWKNYFDRFQVELIAPDGRLSGGMLSPEKEAEASWSDTYRLGGRRVQLLYRGPTPYNPLGLLQFQLFPESESLEGLWRIHLTPERIVTGEYDVWLNGALTSQETRFLVPAEYRSLTIPSTASLPIAVGAYDGRTGATAYFSGRGYPRGSLPEGSGVKPDLSAPGTDIMSASPGGGYTIRSGTSMATPFVTGSAALLLQWGIVRGRDKSLYGQRLKAFLQRGAKRRAGRTYPNEQEGWGMLCLGSSLPD